jgi:virginiamycin B lyase
MVKRLRYAAVLAAFALSACGGGAGVPATSQIARVASAPAAKTPAQKPDRRRRKASAVIFIPHEQRRHRGRGPHPHWVSGATEGILITTYFSSDVHHTNPIGSLATNLAPSGACTPFEGGRKCSVFAYARVGHDDFVFTTYDSPPTGNTFPSSAHILGEAALTDKKVGAGTSLMVPISGLIATIGFDHPFVSVPGNVAVDIGLSINAEDFGGQTILGTANSPYVNPIVVTLTSGGAHASLIKNGGSPGTSVELDSHADHASISYDGNAAAGYSIGVSVSAAGATATTGTLQISPLIVTSVNYFTTLDSTLGFTAPGQATTVDIGEVNGSGGYTLGTTACSGIATFGSISGSGASATLPASAGTGPGTGCVVSITDAQTTTTQINVETTTTAVTVDVAASTVAVSNGGFATYGMATGPDGNMYATVPGSNEIFTLDTQCGNCVFTLIGATAGQPMGIALGPDNNLWFAEQGTANVIGRATTSGQLTEFPIGGAGDGATAIAAGSDGAMWFTENGADEVGRITNSGAYVDYALTGGSLAQGIALGSDGRMWIAAPGVPEMAAVDISGTVSHYATSVAPYGVATGADGNVWFTSQSGNAIGCMTTGGTHCTTVTAAGCSTSGLATLCTNLPSNANPAYMTLGADGALWFAESGPVSGPGAGMIGKITRTGVITSYSIASIFPATTTMPTTPVVAADGSIWFTTAGSVGEFGQIVP